MSAFPAPTYYFTDIVFNAAYFVTSTAALTQTQANALYLLKRTADTATALESFTGGILVNSVSPTTNASVMNIGTTSTADINIGTALRGASAVIHIGDADNNVAGSSVHINNGLNTASNVQILNGIGSTGIINLGSSTSTTNCNSPLTLTYAPSLLTGTNDLGYKLNATAGATTISGATVVSSVVLTAGLWMLVGNVRFMLPGTFGELSITTSTTVLDYTAASTAVGVAGMCLQATRIVSTASSVTYNILANSQAGGTVQSVTFSVYRIG